MKIKELRDDLKEYLKKHNLEKNIKKLKNFLKPTLFIHRFTQNC